MVENARVSIFYHGELRQTLTPKALIKSVPYSILYKELPPITDTYEHGEWKKRLTAAIG